MKYVQSTLIPGDKTVYTGTYQSLVAMGAGNYHWCADTALLGQCLRSARDRFRVV
jgi:hypothetical protein